MARHDAVVVGSGINGLVAGALLAKGGWNVCVVEREERLGGCIYTAELTEPGFVHEVLASWHPLFTGSAAYAELKDDLHAHGLEYLNTELPTATLYPDGESAFLTTSHEANVAALGPGWERTVGEFMPNADLASGLDSSAGVAHDRSERVDKPDAATARHRHPAELDRDGDHLRHESRQRGIRADSRVQNPRREQSARPLVVERLGHPVAARGERVAGELEQAAPAQAPVRL